MARTGGCWQRGRSGIGHVIEPAARVAPHTPGVSGERRETGQGRRHRREVARLPAMRHPSGDRRTHQVRRGDMNTRTVESKRRTAKRSVGAAAVLVMVAGALWWPRTSAVVAQGNAAVQLVPGGQKRMGNPGEKGATYYALEAQTSRLTTRFRDGHVAVAERSLTGEVRTALHDRNGDSDHRGTNHNESSGISDNRQSLRILFCRCFSGCPRRRCCLCG